MSSLAFADPQDHPLDEALVEWLLEPVDGDVEPVAEHLFACGRCASRLDDLRVVTSALAELQQHAHPPLPTPASVAALERRGERLQHLHGADRARVDARLDPQADIIIMHLPVPVLPGPLTVTLCEPDGSPFVQFEHTGPRESGEVMLACHRAIAEGTPVLRVQVRHGAAVVCDAVFAQPD